MLNVALIKYNLYTETLWKHQGYRISNFFTFKAKICIIYGYL